jgi:hypothetical protein
LSTLPTAHLAAQPPSPMLSIATATPPLPLVVVAVNAPPTTTIPPPP